MSLGLRAGSKLHGVWGLFSAYADGKLKALAGHARAYAGQHRVEGAFRGRPSREGWRISFHPATPEIILTVQGGHLVIDARTLEAGPGYHAFVAGFLDYTARRHQWVWDLRSATLHFGDDTGYYRDRDFAALQTAMAGEFAAMCEGLVQMEDGDTPQTVWLPVDVNLAGGRFAATALGLRDRAFFDPPDPGCFFPWWEEGVTARTVKNMALCKMWLDLTWQPPESDSEGQDLANCHGLIDRARKLGAEFTDDEGAGDIEALLRGETLPLGDSACIGYGRHDTWYFEPGGWSVALPGYFREEIGDDGQLCTLGYGDHAVYVRSYLYEAERTGLDWPDRHTEGYSEYLRFETELYRVIIETGAYDDEDGSLLYAWNGTYNAHTGSALISVVSRDAGDAAWAEKILRSARPASNTGEP